ncbi:MAG: PIN domain-containing protein [Gammaproteobacteria bacterium]|nr:PIN domain-containing protein [Gammaproteobacteria bacterium]
MNKVLIDTCCWIDFFRSKNGELGDLVSMLIESNRAVITGVIITELLQGCKTDKEQKQLDQLFSTIDSLSVIDEDWKSTGVALQNLRTQGKTVPVTDGLIATVAQRNKVSVLTIDNHFKYLQIVQYPIKNA